MRRIIVAPAARQDVRAILERSRERFGILAQQRYETLLQQAINDIAADPGRAGVQPFEMDASVGIYHLKNSRDRVADRNARVKAPRHFLAFRLRADGALLISRVLHDRMDVGRHLDDEGGEQ